MHLELVAREGEKLLPPEERERMKKRIRVIRPAELAHFTKKDRRQIKIFFIKLVALSEIVHHDLEEDKEHLVEHEDHIKLIHAKRRYLVETSEGAVKEFIHLIDISAMEPWLEWDVMLEGLHNAQQKKYYETKNQEGVGAAVDNPFLMQVDDQNDEEFRTISQKTRLTPKDIETAIIPVTLEDIVHHIINSRKIITGQIWEGDYDI